MDRVEKLEGLARIARYLILTSTTRAGSGHPSTCLSAVELMLALAFGGYFKFDLKHPDDLGNDRLIFSKGHAAPLLYAIFAIAGAIPLKDLDDLRKFGSPLEGHPTPKFPFAQVATGSLGQGLSTGAGQALGIKKKGLSSKVFVLLGDGEMAEGQVYEALNFATDKKLDNLVGIVDANGLGQTGRPMSAQSLKYFDDRVSGFGWETYRVDGHNIEDILDCLLKVTSSTNAKPKMIIAKTIKGKGVSFIEGKNDWHGRVLDEAELKRALGEIGKVDLGQKGEFSIKNHESRRAEPSPLGGARNRNSEYNIHDSGFKIPDSTSAVSTREAFGNTLLAIAEKYPDLVVLDGDVANSIFTYKFRDAFPDRFIECYIAEQNMVSVALGMSKSGLIPFVGSFAAFLSRAHDQIRMSQYSDANIKFYGSHCGVTVGEDGASQMGLEDIAMFRGLLDSVVLYPSDAVSTEKLVKEMVHHDGISYIRLTRVKTPVIYQPDEEFTIGGSKVLKSSDSDRLTVVGAGATLPEALKAYEELKEEGVNIRVIDLYSVKPLDEETLMQAGKQTGAIITVEDHFREGGLGEAVASVLSPEGIPVHIMAVERTPRSGKPEELLEYEEIDAKAIVERVKDVIHL